jgi:hypothetical protein
MAKITYTDKEDSIINPSPAVNKVVAGDLNEIKASVNVLYDGQDTQDTAIALNTAKRSYPVADDNRLANTSGTNTGDQDISGVATNASAISDLELEQITQNDAIALNTAKVTFPEAPVDGTPYARQSSAWVSITGTVLQESIIVNQANVATTLGGVIDSTKQYFIDGIIDLGAISITVPPTGMTLKGYSFDISGLTSSENNYTMFVSAGTGGGTGSGNLLGENFYISVTGVGSKVYNLYDDTGFSAIEFVRINYNDCTSLGSMHNYRQGLENGTGRFGGSPSLTLEGLWIGGFRITTSIVRSLSASMTEPLFKEGVSFQMNSRFLTDINCDLPALAAFTDFTPANFPNISTVQFKGVILTRDGVADSTDSNLTPFLAASDLSSDWDNNIGLNNTFIGGVSTVTTEISTVITTVDVPATLAALFTASDLVHFSSPANGQLQHNGSDPKEYIGFFGFVIAGTSGDVIELQAIKQLANLSLVQVGSQTRVINNLQGGRDVAYFNGEKTFSLGLDELVFWRVVNRTGTGDVTAELDSSWAVYER